MEFRFIHVCSKCGTYLDVIGREMSKYNDEITIMIKPCRICAAELTVSNPESVLG